MFFRGFERIDESDDDVSKFFLDLKFSDFFQQNSSVEFETVIGDLRIIKIDAYVTKSPINNRYVGF